jgi:hypothetical protein
MIRIIATTACAVALANAAPAYAQVAHVGVGVTEPGVDTGEVNRAIPGTPGAPGVNTGEVNRAIPGTPTTIGAPKTGRELTLHQVRPAPLYRNGLTTAGRPSVGAANRVNGTVGQQGVSGVTGVRGVPAIGSGPLNQRKGVQRP